MNIYIEQQLKMAKDGNTTNALLINQQRPSFQKTNNKTLKSPRNNFSDIIQNIQTTYEHTANTRATIDYYSLSASIQRTIDEIARTQKTFEFKQSLEKFPLTDFAVKTYTNFMKKYKNNPAYGEWNSLFGQQLGYVRSLNNDLLLLIRGSEQQLSNVGNQLAQSIDAAKEHHQRLKQAKVIIPSLNTQYVQTKKECEQKSIEDPDYYGALRKNFSQEHALLNALNEIALISSTHQKDMQKIEFLRRHILFHRGTVFASKKLAITTKQICDTLDNLIGIYETVKPIGTCLDGIYQGIGTLRGYTQTLNNVYRNTFSVVERINSGQNLDLLATNAQQLDPLVASMLQHLNGSLENTEPKPIFERN